MKFFIVIAFTLSVAFGCEEYPPVECGEGEMPCPGGEWDGCPYPDYCIQTEWEMYDGIKCPGICGAQCGMEDMWCDNGMDTNGCWMGNYCMPNPDGTAECPAPPPVCPEVEPAECGEGEMPCWGGMNADGCPYPDYCTMMEWENTDGSKCPGMCSAMCNYEHDLWCDNGVDANGCWMGNYCMPKGTDGTAACPTAAPTCPENVPAECGEGEQVCWGGMDENQCPFPDYCIQEKYENEDGSECWNACPMNCGATDLYCDNGMDSNGCWMGNYCMPTENTWNDCPALCSTPCNYETDLWCDNGMDENGCWMGNYCMPKGTDGTGVCPPVGGTAAGTTTA